MSVSRGVLVTHDQGADEPMAAKNGTTAKEESAAKANEAKTARSQAPAEDAASAPAANQQPEPADPKFEAGHEPGDAGSGLGPFFDVLPDEAKAKVGDVLEGVATDEAAGIGQPHGIANLTQPMPAATDHELAEHPDEVADKQKEAFGQTTVGQALSDVDETLEKK